MKDEFKEVTVITVIILFVLFLILYIIFPSDFNDVCSIKCNLEYKVNKGYFNLTDERCYCELLFDNFTLNITLNQTQGVPR